MRNKNDKSDDFGFLENEKSQAVLRRTSIVARVVLRTFALLNGCKEEGGAEQVPPQPSPTPTPPPYNMDLFVFVACPGGPVGETSRGTTSSGG